MNPDGEYFVDVQTNPIPHVNTWHDLSINQLIDLKTQLQSKLFDFRSNAVIAQALQQNLQRLELLISQRIT
jgi:hypothetical protein